MVEVSPRKRMTKAEIKHIATGAECLEDIPAYSAISIDPDAAVVSLDRLEMPLPYGVLRLTRKDVESLMAKFLEDGNG